jgi:hypothetical protein
MEPELKGEVVYLYAFDVADEIRNDRIRKILSKKAMPYGVQLDHTLPKDIPFYRPLAIDLKREGWKIGGVRVQPVVRVYEVGVVSIMISVPFTVPDLRKLLSFHQPVLDNQRPLDRAAHELCAEIVKNLQEYIVRGMPGIDTPEAYTVFCFNDLKGAQDVETWRSSQRREIAGLLSETDADLLSEQQVGEIFRHCISYTRQDLTVIDWDAALAVDLTGTSPDLIHVLELANLQLEELVLMDKRLDSYLDRAYPILERPRRIWGSFSRADLAKIRRFRMDVAKITDEVTNISKFFGDWFLARIYLSASERFHLATWHQSIQQRLNSLDNLYGVLRTEANETWMLFLEVTIVLLFLVDLLGVFFFNR